MRRHLSKDFQPNKAVDIDDWSEMESAERWDLRGAKPAKPARVKRDRTADLIGLLIGPCLIGGLEAFG